jgi:hypothetical protein
MSLFRSLTLATGNPRRCATDLVRTLHIDFAGENSLGRVTNCLFRMTNIA